MILLGFVRPVRQREGPNNDMENEGLLHYRGYTARPEYSAEDRIFYGKILEISDLVDFQAESTQDLQDEFQKAVDGYLVFCEKIGKEPQKGNAGVKMVTIPELEKNADRYVEMAKFQDILIVQNGKVVAKLTSVECRKG